MPSSSSRVSIDLAVVDASGAPLPDATAQIFWQESGARNWTAGERVDCDSQGRARMRTDRIQHGMRCQVRVRVEAPGYAPAERSWSDCDGGDGLQWNCVLDPALQFGGIVLSPAGPVLLPQG